MEHGETVHTQSQNVELVKQIYRDFLAGDIEAVVAKFDKNIDWSSRVNWPGGPQLPYAGARTGRDAVRDAFEEFRAHVKYDAVMASNTYVTEGDRVLVTGGDYRRDLATDEVTENRWSMLWTIRDGAVVRFRIHQDTVEIL